MAWIDDRAWCHPKLSDLTDRQFRVWVNGNAYSSGFGTKGFLTPGQQRTIGCDTRTRNALVDARVWDAIGTDGTVRIHDWDDHNGKRDTRREADRVRKRKARAAAARDSSPQDSPQDAPQSRRALKEVKEVKELLPRAVTSTEDPHPPTGFAHTAAGSTNEQPPDLTHIGALINQSLREPTA